MTSSRLKKIRLQAGLTQAQLAKFFGLSAYNRISEYENGVRNPSSGIVKLYKLISEKKIKVPAGKKNKITTKCLTK